MQPVATVGARELKTRLGRYLNRVRRGEVLVVTDRSEPVAELRPIGAGVDARAAALARLAALGGLTLPTRAAPPRVRAVTLTRGTAAGAISRDRDERG